MTHVTATKHLTAAHAQDMRRVVYKDGAIDPSELDAIFTLDETAEQRDREWVHLIVEATVDFLVHQQEPRGYIDEANAKWLMDRISKDSQVKTDSELEVLVKVMEAAKSSPESLSAFALEQVKHAVINGGGPVAEHRKLMVDDREDAPLSMELDPSSLGGELKPGTIGAPEVNMLRRILYAFGGSGGVAITRSEAEVLFDINDAVRDAENDPSWTDLFSKALASTVMAASGYSAPSREVALRRENWLDQDTSGVGDFFGRMISGGLSGILNSYKAPSYSDAWKARNAEMGAAVKASEVIDSDEAAWLAERIQKDGAVCDNEIALLKFISEESPDIHPSLKPLIDKVA